MAFPTTGILDNFNRADESPATGWIDGLDGLYGGVKVISNQLGAVSGDSGSYWNVSYAADQEHWVTLAVAGIYNLYIRLNPIGTAGVDGYELEVTTSLSRWRIKRVDDGASTILGADITQAISAGDSVGIEVIGSTITAYYKAAAGSWAAVGNRSDATYNQAGYLAHYLSGTSQRLDDFGGGAVVVAVTPRRTLMAPPIAA